jgi:hypothetical protein
MPSPGIFQSTQFFIFQFFNPLSPPRKLAKRKKCYLLVSKFTSRARVFKSQRPCTLEVNFEFPPLAVRILVVLQFVVADIILYSKSLSSIETVTL